MGKWWGGDDEGDIYKVIQMMMKDHKGKGNRKGRGLSKHSEKNIWIGNLPESITYKDLHDLLKGAGAKWVEVFGGKGKGTGGASFGTAEEAANAISIFNGHMIDGSSIQVDVWTKKEKDGLKA